MKPRKKTQSKSGQRISDSITLAVGKNYSLVRRKPLKQIELNQLRDKIEEYKVL